MFLKNRKGEMTMQQIVTLIVLVASFAVILILFVRLNLGAESDKEICHNSVVQKSTLGAAGDAIPLNCKRNYVCITEDGSCEKMLKPDEKKVKTKEEVYEVLAEELADCWWMFGEGDLNYVGSEINQKLYCSLCSQIAFDDSVKEIFGAEEFDKSEFYDYMGSTKISEGETYAQYLGLIEFIESSGGNLGKVDLNKQHFAMTAITSKFSKVGWVLAGAGIVGVAAGTVAVIVLSGGTATVVIGALIYGGGASIAGGVGAYYLAPTGENADGQKIIKPSLFEVNSEEFKALGCEDITTLS